MVVDFNKEHEAPPVQHGMYRVINNTVSVLVIHGVEIHRMPLLATDSVGSRAESRKRGKMQLAIGIDTAHQGQISPDARIGGNNHCQSSPTSGGKLGNRKREWSGPFFSSPAYTGNTSTSSLLLPAFFFISHTTHLLPSTPFCLHTVQFAGLRGCQAVTVSIIMSISSSRCISITLSAYRRFRLISLSISAYGGWMMANAFSLLSHPA